ncbi:DUF1294 domain-containing protein [Chryseobacterium soli]|uniref:DUF1294 domain-containing protein n=1 Tax=Chryseobacterium soli TaxID=445961 RepID=UPI0029531D16|nr:DUF1294 domain-containing protein [Chryseobacterium soli]MDV7699326.1 DUF1294 domain-containing protein [Chryseobacterium soli]
MIAIVLIFINIVCFAIFGLDKRKAVKHQQRISEKTLLILTFFGGTIGAILGMLVFRHKISKKSFLLKWGLVVLIQSVIIYGWNFYY